MGNETADAQAQLDEYAEAFSILCGSMGNETEARAVLSRIDSLAFSILCGSMGNETVSIGEHRQASVSIFQYPLRIDGE